MGQSLAQCSQLRLTGKDVYVTDVFLEAKSIQIMHELYYISCKNGLDILPARFCFLHSETLT